jgi:Ca2+-binding RTX toxin-like protein
MNSATQRTRSTTVLPIAAVALLALALLAPAARASVRCEQSASGVLRISPYENRNIDMDVADATVRRQGERVLVLADPFDSAGDAVHCTGVAPTVASTKRIVFLQSGLSYGELELTGGLPAPRIEFRAARGSLAYGTVVGTAAADEWTLGGSADEVGLSLDPAEPQRFQVSFDGPGRSVFVAEPHNGDDVVDASQVRDRQMTTILDGGPGDDTLLGSPFRDTLNGGKGRDRLEGNAGNDQIRSRDEYPDVVNCGAGKDRAKVGNGDVVTGCERVERHG